MSANDSVDYAVTYNANVSSVSNVNVTVRGDSEACWRRDEEMRRGANMWVPIYFESILIYFERILICFEKISIYFERISLYILRYFNCKY